VRVGVAVGGAREVDLEFEVVDRRVAGGAFPAALLVILGEAELELGAALVERAGIVDGHRALGEDGRGGEGACQGGKAGGNADAMRHAVLLAGCDISG
jgi:hypothetical protein